MKRWITKCWQGTAFGIAALLAAVGLNGCDSAAYRGQTTQPTESQEVEITTEETPSQEDTILEGLNPITPEGPE